MIDKTLDDILEMNGEELFQFVNDNKSRYDHYGLPVIELEDGEYAYAKDGDQIYSAVKEHIESSAWAFNADFLESMTGIPYEMFEAVQDKCEGANDAVISCIEATCGIESFVENAMNADGAGHFLSSYDGQEISVTEGVNEVGYLYRIN